METQFLIEYESTRRGAKVLPTEISILTALIVQKFNVLGDTIGQLKEQIKLSDVRLTGEINDMKTAINTLKQQTVTKETLREIINNSVTEDELRESIETSKRDVMNKILDISLEVENENWMKSKDDSLVKKSENLINLENNNIVLESKNFENNKNLDIKNNEMEKENLDKDREFVIKIKKCVNDESLNSCTDIMENLDGNELVVKESEKQKIEKDEEQKNQKMDNINGELLEFLKTRMNGIGIFNINLVFVNKHPPSKEIVLWKSIKWK